MPKKVIDKHGRRVADGVLYVTPDDSTPQRCTSAMARAAHVHMSAWAAAEILAINWIDAVPARFEPPRIGGVPVCVGDTIGVDGNRYVVTGIDPYSKFLHIGPNHCATPEACTLLRFAGEERDIDAPTVGNDGPGEGWTERSAWRGTYDHASGGVVWQGENSGLWFYTDRRGTTAIGKSASRREAERLAIEAAARRALAALGEGEGEWKPGSSVAGCTLYEHPSGAEVWQWGLDRPWYWKGPGTRKGDPAQGGAATLEEAQRIALGIEKSVSVTIGNKRATLAAHADGSTSATVAPAIVAYDADGKGLRPGNVIAGTLQQEWRAVLVGKDRARALCQMVGHIAPGDEFTVSAYLWRFVSESEADMPSSPGDTAPALDPWTATGRDLEALLDAAGTRRLDSDDEEARQQLLRALWPRGPKQVVELLEAGVLEARRGLPYGMTWSHPTEESPEHKYRWHAIFGLARVVAWAVSGERMRGDRRRSWP